jgi:hypothetical protein
MKLCYNGHSRIVHENEHCPLCQLTKHNLIVHQFIESKEINLVEKLIEYQEMRRMEDPKKCTNDTCNNGYDYAFATFKNGEWKNISICGVCAGKGVIK